MHRRRVLVAIAALAFVGALVPTDTSAVPATAIGNAAARREFLKFVAIWNKGTLADFTAYEPLEVESNGSLLTPDKITALFQSLTPNLKDKKPVSAKLIQFGLIKNPQRVSLLHPSKLTEEVTRRMGHLKDFSVYAATVEHQFWVADLCLEDSDSDTGGLRCTGEPGHVFTLSGWYIIFDGPKIKRLVLTGMIS